MSQPTPESLWIRWAAWAWPRRAALILAAILLGLTVEGIIEVLDRNDFEVFHFAAELAADRSLNLYTDRTEGKNRVFLYPPSGAIVLRPLAWLSHDAAGVVFTLLRTAALTALLLLSARLARLGANSHRPLAPLALAALLVVFRPIDNEYGNGQINSLICLGAVGGAALIMRGGARSILGIAAASLAAAVKPPPALVLAAPLLHRRGWAMSATAVAIAALMFGLPRVWHGAEGAEQLRREFARRAETMMRDARAKDRQTTLHEIIYFSLAQSRLDPDVRWTFDEGFHEEREGGRVRVRVPDPMSPNAMFSLWFAASAAVGGLYLLARRLLWRGAAPPWTWDVAALCVFVLLLEPILRKAHGVILVVPAAWILAQWGEEARLLGSWRSWAARNRPRATLGFIAAGGLWAGDDLPIPFSPTPMPYNISMFLALIAFLALLAIEARGRRRLGEPTHQCGRTV